MYAISLQPFPKVQKELEQKITMLEQNLCTEENFDEYMNTKNELKKCYDNIADGAKIHSKCNWVSLSRKIY